MKNYIKPLFFLLVSLFPAICNAQLVYPVVGTYKGKSAQGMAIWGDNAYLFNDGGRCRVLNLKNGEVTREFLLASAGKNTHVNAVCFGNEYAPDTGCPVIYISEYNMPSRCFVECFNDTSSTLLQTIQVQNKNKSVFVQSWIVDTKGGWLYTIARMSPPAGEKYTKKVRISQYRLPVLSEGENVILTENDCIETFIVEYANGVQGGKIKGKYMYLVSGLQETFKGQFNAERAIQIIDLKQRKLIKSIDLRLITTNEPEDMDFYRNKALLYTGQEGGIYNIKYK